MFVRERGEGSAELVARVEHEALLLLARRVRSASSIVLKLDARRPSSSRRSIWMRVGEILGLGDVRGLPVSSSIGLHRAARDRPRERRRRRACPRARSARVGCRASRARRCRPRCCGRSARRRRPGERDREHAVRHVLHRDVAKPRIAAVGGEVAVAARRSAARAGPRSTSARRRRRRGSAPRRRDRRARDLRRGRDRRRRRCRCRETGSAACARTAPTAAARTRSVSARSRPFALTCAA